MVPWPTQVHIPNGTSISSDFARLTIVTDRPTDRATRSVTIGRIYVRSTTNRPNNNNNVCNQTVSRIVRHHALNECISHAFSAADIPVRKEPAGLVQKKTLSAMTAALLLLGDAAQQKNLMP